MKTISRYLRGLRALQVGIALLAAPIAHADFLEQVRADYAAHYAEDKLVSLGVLAGAGGLLSHDDVEQTIGRKLNPENRPLFGRSSTKQGNELGAAATLRAALPVYLLAAWLGDDAAAGSLLDSTARWGRRSMRALLLGLPQHAVFMASDSDPEAALRLWRGDPGPAGQAFLAGVPLLTAARLAENGLIRVGLFALSALPGMARIDGNGRQLSHAVIGWGLSFLSTGTVARDDPVRELPFEIVPVLLPDGGAGIRLERRW